MRLLALISSVVVMALASAASSACGGSASSGGSDGGDSSTDRTDASAPGARGDGAADGEAVIEGGSDAAAGDGGGGTMGVACGGATCATPAWCQICKPADPASPKACETDFAKQCTLGGGRPPLLMSCDGKEDCSGTERCVLFEGSVGTYARCMAEESKIGSVVCRSLADCPTDATACAPYQHGATSPYYAVKVCE